MARHEHRYDWRALLFYGIVSLLVLAAGGLTLYTFFERHTLVQRVEPEALPPVTVVTTDPSSKLAAAWVDLLTRSDFAPTLVAAENFTATEGVGVVALCDVARLTPRLRAALDQQLARRGGLVVLGAPPGGKTIAGLAASTIPSVGSIRIADAPSPVLARVQPGHEIGARSTPVAVLEETPEMKIDARWSGNARAAAAHFEKGASRVLWFGFDPASLYYPADRQLALLLRASVRWVSGQPVSDGAIGTTAIAKALAPTARVAGRQKKFSFSVDRLEKAGTLGLRLVNRGGEPLENPTVKIWLPPGATRATFSGSFIARRKVTISEAEGETAAIVTLPKLAPYEERLLKLRIE